uniref:Cell division cycle protein 48 homolog n=1 Tax=Rhizophora mucronata TaxID=61149 RepID=A0A2P2MJ19_RHIMU
MQIVSLRFLPLRRTVSPRKSWSFSIVSGCIETTELSSLTASSTSNLFGDFFLSKIAVEKSFFPADFESDDSAW